MILPKYLDALNQVRPRFEKGRPWCTQEQIRPISRAALNASCSDRVRELSTPKKNFGISHDISTEYVYSCGRPSTITTVHPKAMVIKCSPRLERLAQPRPLLVEFTEHCARPFYETSIGRPSPVWTPPEISDKWTGENSRIQELAKPRTYHPEYEPLRWGILTVSPAALKASSSPRIELIAKPIIKKELSTRESVTEIPESALLYNATENICQMAKFKVLPADYQMPKSVPIEIPREALKAKTTERIQKLAEPVKRQTMEHILYDMTVFTVKESALKAKCSKRLKELAEPKTYD